MRERGIEILLNRGKRFFVELFHGRERKVAKIIVIMTIFQSDANISKTKIFSQAEELSSRVHEWMGPVHRCTRLLTIQLNLTRTWQEQFFVSSQHLTRENDAREEEEEKKEEHRRHQGRKNWGISLRINLVIVNLVKENLVRVNLVRNKFLLWMWCALCSVKINLKST